VPHSVVTQTSYDKECNSAVFITIFRTVVFMFNYFWKGMCELMKRLRTKRKESDVSVREDGGVG
jgi:hypothetical protein